MSYPEEIRTTARKYWTQGFSPERISTLLTAHRQALEYGSEPQPRTIRRWAERWKLEAERDTSLSSDNPRGHDARVFTRLEMLFSEQEIVNFFTHLKDSQRVYDGPLDRFEIYIDQLNLERNKYLTPLLRSVEDEHQDSIIRLVQFIFLNSDPIRRRPDVNRVSPPEPHQHPINRETGEPDDIYETWWREYTGLIDEAESAYHDYRISIRETLFL